MSQQTPETRRVDHTALRFGMVLTITILLIGFLLDSPLLVAFVAVAQLLGAANSPYAPYRLIYQKLIIPNGILKADVITDNPEPHRFALLVGGIFNLVAFVAHIGGATGFAWLLVWVVIALANLNFWLRICVGCLLYYQLNRLGVRGFTSTPIEKGNA